MAIAHFIEVQCALEQVSFHIFRWGHLLLEFINRECSPKCNWSCRFMKS